MGGASRMVFTWAWCIWRSWGSELLLHIIVLQSCFWLDQLVVSRRASLLSWGQTWATVYWDAELLPDVTIERILPISVIWLLRQWLLQPPWVCEFLKSDRVIKQCFVCAESWVSTMSNEKSLTSSSCLWSRNCSSYSFMRGTSGCSPLYGTKFIKFIIGINYCLNSGSQISDVSSSSSSTARFYGINQWHLDALVLFSGYQVPFLPFLFSECERSNEI